MKKNKYLEKIWNQVPANYYEEGRTNNILQKIWHDEKINKLKLFLNPKFKNILDIGSGSGHITNEIKTFLPNSEVTGLDVYNKAIEFGRRRYKNIKFVQADAHKLPFKPRTFDLVTSTESLEHVVSPKEVLSEMKRVLKDDGLLIVEMDSGNILFRLVWFIWTRLGPGTVWRRSHLTTFNSKKLKQMILNAGFTIIDKKSTHFGMGVIYASKKSI